MDLRARATGRAATRQERAAPQGGGRAGGRRGVSVSGSGSSPPRPPATSLVALGEVMLRFETGDGRFATSRTSQFRREAASTTLRAGSRRCFRLRTTMVTAFAGGQVGRLLEDLILQEGVDSAHVAWLRYGGIGRSVRNGLDLVGRGFGVRAVLGTSDRARSAAAAMQAGDVGSGNSVRATGRAWSTAAESSPRSGEHCGLGTRSDDCGATSR